MTKPKILVVLLGGTITMTPSRSGGVVPTLGVEELIAGVPGLVEHAILELVSLFGLPGASLTLQHLVEVAALLLDRFANGIDGAVVVQGTDTIEDTAFVLDLLLGLGHPVVVTGAMRAPQSAGADGPANLLAAVTVVCDPEVAQAGVLVVLNDEVHAARFAQKSHTSLTNAFESPGAGPLGAVVEGKTCLIVLPKRAYKRLELPRNALCEVAVVSLGLGEDGRLLTALPGLGYKGVVVEGMGAGHVPAAAVAQVAALTEVMPVVLCSRVRAGIVYTQTYGFAGSEMNLIEKGVVPSGRLGPSKSRLLLSLLISSGSSQAAIRTAFALT